MVPLRWVHFREALTLVFGKFDADTSEFLGALDEGTRKVYSNGLSAFLTFYQSQGTIKDFLDRVEEDFLRPRREKTRVARKTLKEFVDWLQKKGYKPKSIRVYVAAIQSEARYFDIAITTRYVDLPTSRPVSSKYPWNIEEINRFINLFKEPIYKSLATATVQSGLSISDLLALTYTDIKQEYEAGITPLCFDIARIKTEIPYMSFIGTWGVEALRQHLEPSKLKIEEPLFPITDRAVREYFRRIARKFIGKWKERNPCRIHSLRAAFRTILGDHKVEPLYIEFFMGHKVPEQQRVYVSKSRDGWRQTYKEQVEPWLTPPKGELA